jgi:hypothetical protein
MQPSLEVIRQARDELRCRIARVAIHIMLAVVVAFVVGTLANEIFTQINHVRVTWPGEMQ